MIRFGEGVVANTVLWFVSLNKPEPPSLNSNTQRRLTVRRNVVVVALAVVGLGCWERSR